VNTGHSGDTHVGSARYVQLFNNRMLTQLSIGEVLHLQAAGRLFAVGRYQFIPTTLHSAVKALGFDVSLPFDQANQDHLAREYLLYMKRPRLAGYLKGKDYTVTQANQDLCQEWASMPCNNGAGYYDGDSAGNGAHGGVRRALHVMALLQLLREANLDLVRAWGIAKDAAEAAAGTSPPPVITTTTTTASPTTTTAPPVTTVPGPPHRPQIVLIGDSLSVGYSRTIGRTAAGQGLDVSYIDAQVGRGLTKGRDDGLEVIGHTEQLATADGVVLALGTNMVESEAAFGNGLRAAITEIRAKRPDTKIFVPYLFSFKDGTPSAQRRDVRNQLITHITQELDATPIKIDDHVDAPQERAAHMSADQVHLDAATYAATGRVIVAHVKAALGQE
jgi:hypothetical protein